MQIYNFKDGVEGASGKVFSTPFLTPDIEVQTMGRNTAALKWLLLAGALYFLAISIVYMLRIKVPMLFVYYNLPSYGYEDRIISFLSFGWSVFLFTASLDPVRNRDAVKAILVIGLAATFGLHVINNVTDFRALAPSVDPLIFRIEARALTAYFGALVIFYFLSVKEAEKEST